MSSATLYIVDLCFVTLDESNGSMYTERCLATSAEEAIGKAILKHQNESMPLRDITVLKQVYPTRGG